MKNIFDFDNANETPLYRRYVGQVNPQSAFIEIDLEKETIDADWNGEIGNAIPLDVYNDIILRFSVSPYLSLEDLKKLFDEIKDLAEKLISTSEIVWDGNNCVGKYDEEIRDQIRCICRDTEFDWHEVFTAIDLIVGQENEEKAYLELLVNCGGDIEEAIKETHHIAETVPARIVEEDELIIKLEEVLEDIYHTVKQFVESEFAHLTKEFPTKIELEKLSREAMKSPNIIKTVGTEINNLSVAFEPSEPELQCAISDGIIEEVHAIIRGDRNE